MRSHTVWLLTLTNPALVRTSGTSMYSGRLSCAIFAKYHPPTFLPVVLIVILSNVNSFVGRWTTADILLITRAVEKYFAKHTRCFFDAPIYKHVLEGSMKKSKSDHNNLIIQQCIDLLRQDDLKYEIKVFLEPIISMLFNMINPYIYVFLTINILMFVMVLSILILLVVGWRR